MEKIQREDFQKVSTIHNLKTVNGEPLYAASRPDLEANKYETSVYCGREPKALQIGLSGKQITVLRDGKLLFPCVLQGADKQASKDGYLLTVFCTCEKDGTDLKEFFRVPLSVSSAAELCGGKFLLQANYDGNRPDIEMLPKEMQEAALEEFKASQDVIVCEELPYNADGKGFISRKRKRLYVYDTVSGELSALTAPLFDTAGFAVNSDGSTVAFAGSEYDLVGTVSQGLWMYRPEDGTTQQVYPENAWTIGPMTFMGDKLYLLAAPYENYTSTNKLTVCAAGPEGPEVIADTSGEDLGVKTVSDCKGSGTTFASHNGKLYYISTYHSGCALFSLVPGELPVRETPEDFDIDHFAAGDHLYVCGSEWGMPEEVYELSGKALTRVSSVNEKFASETQISKPEFMTFKNREGMTLEGFVIKPADFDPEKSYPGILEIHGGPRLTASHSFNHEYQGFAAKGYFVFFCNPRGSAGWGNEFANIRGVRGTIDYYDIMDFTDAVLEKYPQIDGNRLGVTGGSYGGYMANWIIGHTTRFKGAVSCRSNSNIIGNYGMSDRGLWSCEASYGGNIWDDHDLIWEQSPLKHVRNAETPTLFMHSLDDHRCRFHGSTQMYTAMLMHGIPAKMVLFKGEPHGLSRIGKPSRRLRRLSEMYDWMDKWVR